MSSSTSLDSVPQEVLEHIAFFSAVETFLGPPSALVSLLTTNRRIHSRLSITSNHHLYARVFAAKFDLMPAVRRLGVDRTTPDVLARELQRRCKLLKQIRSRSDAIIANKPCPSLGPHTGEPLHSLLFHAYLLMLENEGKNEQQLRSYAGIEGWLQLYWFDENGASLARSSIREEEWPPNSRESSLAMWLFWFLLKPEDYKKEDEVSWTALEVLKVLALGAHKYNLTSPSWVDFLPSASTHRTDIVLHYSEDLQLTPPPLATPAILCFLTLVNQMAEGFGYSTPLTPSNTLMTRQPSHEWECEWGRCVSLGQPEFDRILTDSFRPGSIEGVWEGLFTYTEFTAYASLLGGAPPRILQKSIVVRHRQTWKLREHHLLGPDPSRSDSGIEVESDNVESLSPGDPLRSYFPTGTQISESWNGIEVQEPGRAESMHYQRSKVNVPCGDEEMKQYVQDVIITGEGHSAWGQFNLLGRVRPCDGFVSLSKEYGSKLARWMEIAENGYTVDTLLVRRTATLRDDGAIR